MVDLIESIICNGCPYMGDCDKVYIDECIIEKKDIHEGIRAWLSSFDSSSATECFTAVNLLKQRLESKDEKTDTR